ncbi:MAG: hypothetical protein LIP08_13335 [Bacteroides sp.]|nr:hypothetical protein [Bacteroides sp.]
MLDNFSGFLYLIIGIIVVAGIFQSVRNHKVVSLSLSKFVVDPNSEDQIIIEGRKTGLWQWILVQLKLGNIYKIHVRQTFISYSEDSVRGNMLILTPVHKISSTTCGFRKPIGLLITGILLVVCSVMLLLMGEFAYFFLGLVFAALCVALYIYRKYFLITIETVGSQRFGFSFKRSVIENVPIEIEKIEQAIMHINNLVIESK